MTISVRDFVPPIVARIARRFRPKAPLSVEDRVFPDYESAAAHCVQGWHDRELAAEIVDDAIAGRTSADDLPAVLDPIELRAAAAIGWALHDRGPSAERLTVLDFGGSAGFNYFAVKALFPRQSFRWHVVETPVMSAAAAPLAGEELQFVADLSAAPPPDVIFSCGVLQYLPRPLETIDRLLELRARYLALFRTTMTDTGETICAVQQALRSRHLHFAAAAAGNDVKVRYPVTFVPREVIRERLSRSYDVVVEIDEGVLNRVGSRAIHGYAMLGKRREGAGPGEVRYSAEGMRP
jgi:putative methyltransferase (TIGR04325 family)